MMTVLMDSSSTPSSWELAQRLYKKNIELENGVRKSAQSKVPSDPNAWLQMCENYEAIILEDHDFSEKHEVEYLLWQLHYRRIEEFRTHINAAVSAGSVTSQGGKNPARSDRIKKIRSVFKSFLSEATGFYHDLILKVRAKYGLPLGYFSEGSESRSILAKDEKKSAEMKKGLMSCHRCLIYLGDLARYKGLYGEGDSVSRDYAAASSYYLQASSLCPSSGNPHHQLAILASYSGDELVAVYRYFRSLAVDCPFTTARDNLIIAFEKNRHCYSQLPSNAKVTSARTLPLQSSGRGRGRGDARLQAKDSKTESSPIKEHNLCVTEIFKTFCTQFVRFNGIMFTRTSLETFEEIFSLIISDLQELLSTGPEEELNFGQDAAENALVLVRLITILIFTVHNVNRDPEGQLYAEILQRTVLLQNASAAAFEFAGHILKRCIQLHDATSSNILPAILVFIEWLACHPDIAAGSNVEEKQAHARSLFWNQFVCFLNKLMLSGLVSSDGNEDEKCFSDMGRYDDDGTDNRIALWEDFELRGFLPLVPAQVILDFSRKHSFGSEGCMMEKRARVQRILAAGRALTDVVQVDQQGMYFDPKMNKFVIGAKPPSYEDHMYTGMPHTPELNASKCGNLVERTVDLEASEARTVKLEMTPPMIPAPLHAGGGEEEEEEEEEEIVFKPVLSEKYANLNAAKSAAYEMVQPVQISSKGDWATYGAPRSTSLNNTHMSTVVSANSQLHTPVTTIIQQSLQPVCSNTSKWLIEQEAILSDGLNNLNVIKNGLLVEHGLQEGLNRFQPTAFSPLVSAPANLNTTGMYSEMKVVEPVIPSKHDSIVPSGATSDGSTMNLSAALPMASRKNPVSRPVRHLGPPPGFSHVPSKQLDDKNSNSVIRDQLLQIDDYSWLDGYQPVTAKGMGIGSTNHTAVRVSTTSTSSTFSGAMTFPFPGKQISTVQTRVANEKLQDFQTFEHLKPFSDQQLHQTNLQASLLPEQHQAQPLWPSRYFV